MIIAVHKHRHEGASYFVSGLYGTVSPEHSNRPPRMLGKKDAMIQILFRSKMRAYFLVEVFSDSGVEG